MNRNLFFTVLTVLLLWVGCSKQPTLSTKNEISRIISLSPHITEILYALDQQDKIVAVSDFCAYPPEALKKEHIGGLLNPNLEKILMLKPDVLIGTPAHNKLAMQLASKGISVIMLPNDRLQDVFFTIDSLGNLLKCSQKAAALIKSIRDSLSFFQQQAQQIKIKPSAALIIGRDPGSVRHVTVAGAHTFLDSLWTLLGGKNIFADLTMKYAQVGQEALLTRKPQIIIEFRFKQQWNAHKDSLNYREWQTLAEIPAVNNRQIYVLTADYTLIPGPRLYLLTRDYLRILQHYQKMLIKNSKLGSSRPLLK